jgi:(R,R)-butanediol dehydrogenase/meso-butanediol dehydrogenase/diacetyl reductase
MQAVVFHGARDLRLEDRPEPVPGPSDVKVRVAYNGICGADLKEYFLGPMFIPASNVPIIVGHEASGVVVEVGADAPTLHVGDHVAIEPVRTCGCCRFCTTGAYNLCGSASFHGYALPGTLAEYVVVPTEKAHKLPDSVSLELGALSEPMSVAMHGVLRGRFSGPGPAVVYGGGPIGIGVYLGLRAEGAERIAVVEPSPTRRRVLKGLGCEFVIDPGSTDAAAAVLEWTSGMGAEVSYDAAGAPGAFSAALSSTASGGDVVIIAAHEQEVLFDPNVVLLREVNIKTSSSYANDFPRVIRHMAHGCYPMDGWVEHIALTEVGDAIERLREARATKILVDVSPRELADEPGPSGRIAAQLPD